MEESSVHPVESGQALQPRDSLRTLHTGSIEMRMLECPAYLHQQKFHRETAMSSVTIRSLKNGPYLVEGEVDLFDPEGNKVSVDRATIALCRCGASSNKPFCDGTHSKIGFQAAEAANPASAE